MSDPTPAAETPASRTHHAMAAKLRRGTETHPYLPATPADRHKAEGSAELPMEWLGPTTGILE